MELTKTIALKKNPKGRFRVVLIDPPSDNTRLKLGYPTLKNSEWMDLIKLDDFMDDGLIFIWATNN